jgi:hypothetical protein
MQMRRTFSQLLFPYFCPNICVQFRASQESDETTEQIVVSLAEAVKHIYCIANGCGQCHQQATHYPLNVFAQTDEHIKDATDAESMHPENNRSTLLCAFRTEFPEIHGKSSTTAAVIRSIFPVAAARRPCVKFVSDDVIPSVKH